MSNTTVQEILAGMASRLNPQAAAGMDAVIQYDLTGEGGGTYHAVIKDNVCTVNDGPHGEPSMTLTMEATDFVQLIEGSLDGMTAFMSGKLKIGGDMGLAMKLQSLFS